MRIAHVITRMILGGAQENTLLTCEDLRRVHGDDVLLITGPALGPEGSLLDRAAERGTPLAIIPQLRRAIDPRRDALSYFALKRILEDFKPDVVHTHSAKGGLLGRAAARAIRAPFVVHTVHGAPFHPYQNAAARKFFQSCERWGAKRCDAFISVADAMTDLMVNAKVAPREKFTTIYSGMEVEPFLESAKHREATRRELGFKDDEIVIGKIARLFHLKGHDDVIEAAKAVVREQPKARFLFVGDGILRGDLQAKIDSAGLTEYFRFTGLVPPQKIPAMISAMDVVVHTSLREGLARVLPQGMLGGKPVVSYDIDGAREVVINGETGFLIPPRDVAQLASALIDLSERRGQRHEMGAAGRARCKEKFDHEYMTARIREVYLASLAGSH